VVQYQRFGGNQDGSSFAKLQGAIINHNIYCEGSAAVVWLVHKGLQPYRQVLLAFLEA
jgi:hypothetical protein